MQRDKRDRGKHARTQEEFHTKRYPPSRLSHSISLKMLFAQKHILNTTVCARACSSHPNCRFIHLSLLTVNSGYLSWIYHWILSNECFLFTSFAPGGSSRHHGSEETRSSALLSRASSSLLEMVDKYASCWTSGSLYVKWRWENLYHLSHRTMGCPVK